MLPLKQIDHELYNTPRKTNAHGFSEFHFDNLTYAYFRGWRGEHNIEFRLWPGVTLTRAQSRKRARIAADLAGHEVHVTTWLG